MVSYLYVNVNEYGKIKNSKKVLTYKNKYSIIPYKINMGKTMETLWRKAKGYLKWQPAAVLKSKNFQTAVFLLISY